MYIVASIYKRVVYSQKNYVFTSLEDAKAKLEELRKEGITTAKIYFVMDMREVEE